MLVTKQQDKPAYYFVPYKFGCFSFQANADLATMTKYNQVKTEGSSWKKTDNIQYINDLKKKKRQTIKKRKINNDTQTKKN